MLIRKTFESWLKQFDNHLHIEPLVSKIAGEKKGETVGTHENQDVDVLYWGNRRLCSVPKGLKTSKGWAVINDKRDDEGYVTSDGIQHRSLSGIGLVLMQNGIIDAKQFVRHFISSRNKEFLQKLIANGNLPFYHL